ncbi:MAG TPA: alpha/beta hydrolase [Phenylobacterium sp.]|uniref:alpha/beta hydrolase n=1 Tax=Phenylobacterium sp. TaxID=1871053 RepID=UPI002B49E8CD|nr:alpha/beta hydrolase [Phenylobacterium sp.]HKR87479.1 alpha/beta hydrolase [Phenylobacterium sp.]
MATDDAKAAARVESDGTIQVPSFSLPISAALSASTARAQAQALAAALPIDISAIDKIDVPDAYRAAVDAFRAGLDEMFARPLSEKLLAEFPVEMRDVVLAGVRGEAFIPANCDPDRILLNLHGGGFCSGYGYVSRIEAIPMAHLTGMKVVSIDYRQGYEHKYPAATDDVVAVYRELLQHHAPENIVIYGGSAGGILSLQAAYRIVADGLPAPAAIGVFGAGGFSHGDSDYFAAIGAATAPPVAPIPGVLNTKLGYFSTARADDPFVDPTLGDPALLAKFPPSMILTATRAFDMSPAIAAHRALIRAGADSSLHVFDGLGHCFYYDASAPEPSEAYQAIVRFFKRRLRA